METNKLKKIAVVVVHGVGDQQPSESANKVGDLLQSLNVGQTGPGQREIPRYTPFTEQKLHIDVRPVIVKPRKPKQAECNEPKNEKSRDQEERNEPKNEKSRDQEERNEPKKETQGPFNAWVQ